ncbi:MAG TPA: YciI family protein [Candidatus Limnocylindria bacterium]
MRYLILLYADEGAWASLGAEAREQNVRDNVAFSADLAAAGARVLSSALASPDRVHRVIGVGEGAHAGEDGSAASDGAWLAGFHVIECPDAAAAEAWLARVPLLPGESASLHPLVEGHENGPE